MVQQTTHEEPSSKSYQWKEELDNNIDESEDEQATGEDQLLEEGEEERERHPKIKVQSNNAEMIKPAEVADSEETNIKAELVVLLLQKIEAIAQRSKSGTNFY